MLLSNADDEINLALAAGTMLIALMLTFVFYFVVSYQRQRRQFNWEREKMQRSLLQAQTEIREETLRTISRELHDHLGAQLSGLKFYVAQIKSPLTDYEANLKNDVYNLLGQLHEDVRSISRSMHSKRLESIGIIDALKEDIGRFNRNKKINASLEGAKKIYGLTGEAQIFIYRICQELLNNAGKHAGTAEIVLKVDETDTEFLLNYRDNGNGFDVDAALKSPGSSGLHNMRERCKLIGANLKIKSAPGEGTKVVISLPLKV